MPIAAFLWFILLTAYTPGPNNILAMSMASQRGFRKTMPLCLGNLAGFVLVMTVCVLGTKFLYMYLPSAKPVLQAVGAAYILYLAWSIYRSKQAEAGTDEGAGNRVGFSSGFLLQCINPKFHFYCLTAMSSFVLPYTDSLWAVVAWAALLILASSTANLLWAFFGSAFQKLFLRHGRVLNIVMAILLVWCAVALVQ